MKMYLAKKTLLFLCVAAIITSLTLLRSTDVASAEEAPCMVSVECACGDSISCSGTDCFGSVELGAVACGQEYRFCRMCRRGPRPIIA